MSELAPVRKSLRYHVNTQYWGTQALTTATLRKTSFEKYTIVHDYSTTITSGLKFYKVGDVRSN